MEQGENILIVSYYELKESLKLAGHALEECGWNVFSYPLFQMSADVHCKIDNYDEDMIKYTEDNSIDVVLYWYINIPVERMEKIANYNYTKKIKNIFFNWDDPFNWDLCLLKDKSKYLDTVFACSKARENDYIENGVRKFHILYPGFDSKVHYPIIDDREYNNYECDISICCTNLYEDCPNQIINRKELVDAIYANQNKYNYKFHIYGPDKFEKLYPLSYKGFISYENTGKLFNASKINICTHVQNADSYLNERVILIMASGGLLYVDPVDNIENILNKDAVVFIDKDNYINQIVDILKSYDQYYITRHNAIKESKKYTWKEWAKFITKNIIE